MQLLTQELRETLPKLSTQEGNPDPIAYVKFFHPLNNWTWYVTEFDGEDSFFGLVFGFETEWGYFSLKELESTNVHGLGIERDVYFTPTPISEIRKLHPER